MNKKIISMLLATVIASSTSIGVVGTQKVKAVELNAIELKQEKIKDKEAALSLIEKYYLQKESNGTYTISDKAYSVIDGDLLNEIKNGSSQINNLILNGSLKFNNQKKATYVNKSLQSGHAKMMASARNTDVSTNYGAAFSNDGFTAILTSYSYCSNYVWHWYGFETNVNAEGSRLLKIEISLTQKETAFTGGVTALAGFAVPAGVVGGAIELWLEGLKAECEKGEGGRGVYLKAWGAPSSAQIYSIKLR